MRLEVLAAYGMGIGLPTLETLRRRTNFDEIVNYVDDYLMGGLLLWAAIAASRRVRHADAFLAGAWGVLCGGMFYSFFGQIMRTDARDISGYSHGFVIAVKGILFAVAILGMILSVRNSARQRTLP